MTSGPGEPADDPIGRLIELAVYAPIGAVAIARERLPELVDAGRERVEQRLTLARFIGQMVVQQGRRELERRLAADAPVRPTRPAAPAPPSAPPTGVTAVTADVAGEVQVPAARELPVDDYESLAASQVVARLAALDPVGLAAVEAFERSHRNRRTVLNRIAQLRAGS